MRQFSRESVFTVSTVFPLLVSPVEKISPLE